MIVHACSEKSGADSHDEPHPLALHKKIHVTMAIACIRAGAEQHHKAKRNQARNSNQQNGDDILLHGRALGIADEIALGNDELLADLELAGIVDVVGFHQGVLRHLEFLRDRVGIVTLRHNIGFAGG